MPTLCARFPFEETDEQLQAIEPMALMQRVQAEPQRFRLTPDGHLTLLSQEKDTRKRLKQTADFLDALS